MFSKISHTLKSNKIIAFSITASVLLYCGAIWLALSNVNESYYVYILFITWLLMVLYSLKKPNERIFILMYLVAFFNFQIGRSLLIALGMYKEAYKFSVYDDIRGQQIVLFSFIVFSLAVILLEKFRNKNSKQLTKRDYNSEQYVRLRQISKVLFYIFYFVMMLSLFMTIKYVIEYGYPSIFLDKSAGVPIIIRKLGDLAPFFFYFYLSTMPSRKDITIPVVLWGLFLVLSLVVGSRFNFVIGAITLFAYFVLRNKMNTGSKVWVSRKLIITTIISGVIIIGGFSIYNDTRFGFEATEKNPAKLVTKFFYDQGINVNNNKRIFKYENKIPEDRIYSFNSMISFYERNIESLFSDEKTVVGNNLDRAYNGNSLSDMLSVTVLGEEKYLSGLGVGSSYIAEVFHDFSWIGLLVVNVLYGYIIVLIGDMTKRTPLAFVISINVFTGMLKAPRANADLFLLRLIDPMLWIAVLIIFFTLWISFSDKRDIRYLKF